MYFDSWRFGDENRNVESQLTLLVGVCDAVTFMMQFPESSLVAVPMTKQGGSTWSATRELAKRERKTGEKFKYYYVCRSGGQDRKLYVRDGQYMREKALP